MLQVPVWDPTEDENPPLYVCMYVCMYVYTLVVEPVHPFVRPPAPFPPHYIYIAHVLFNSLGRGGASVLGTCKRRLLFGYADISLILRLCFLLIKRHASIHTQTNRMTHDVT